MGPLQAQQTIRQGLPMAEEYDLQVLTFSHFFEAPEEQKEELDSQRRPSADAAGCCWCRASNPMATVRIPFRLQMMRPGASVGGPMLMTIADAAMYALVLGLLGKEEGPRCVTSHLHIEFLARPPLHADLLATASLVKAGKRMVVISVSVYSLVPTEQSGVPPSKCLVATASGGYSRPHQLPSRL